MKKLWQVLGALVLLLAVAFLVARTPDSEPVAMQAKYGGTSSHFVKTQSGMSIHYRDQGCRDCPAIVLLHGANASLHTFEPLIEILQERYRFVSFDQPGHGLTGPAPDDDYSAGALMDAINVVADVTGIERFAVFGNSMGGWLAWRYAMERPERTTALILVNASGAPPAPDAEKPRLYLGARVMQYALGRWLVQHITPRSVIKKSLEDNFAIDDGVSEALVDRYWELLRYPGNRRAAGLRALVDREPHYAQRLAELQVPTLILWGHEDQVTPRSHAKVFNGLIPNSELQVFSNVGHLTMEEAPRRTADALRHFLEKQITLKQKSE